MYSSFLKPFNPAKAQKDVAENNFCGDDFDISLFVSSRPSSDSSSSSGHKKSDSDSSLHSCENPTTNGTGAGGSQDMDDQHVSKITAVPVFLFFSSQMYSCKGCNLNSSFLHWTILVLICQNDTGNLPSSVLWLF